MWPPKVPEATNRVPRGEGGGGCESVLYEISQYPQSAFQALSGVGGGGGQQQFATQTLRVHLLGIDKTQQFAN